MATSLPLQASICESERGNDTNHYDEGKNCDKESNPLQQKAHALKGNVKANNPNLHNIS